ncbi:unnamed protein product [Brassica oleracea]
MDCLMNKSKKKKNSEANQRLRSFQENDKVLLQDHIELCNGKSNPIKTFSANQIIQATNNFSQNNQIPGEFIYRGMLENRHVLIKRSILSLHPPDTLARICSDIAVSSMVSGHKNFLKLLGCCLEFEDPVLVSKLTGFCVCVSIPEGQTFVKIDAVRADGVLDYLEYKYMTSDVVTENTDVFSSGVLLQNLLIGKHGVMNLMRVSDRVCKFVEEGRIVEILDPQMLENMDDDETGELERRQMEAVLSNAREMDDPGVTFTSALREPWPSRAAVERRRECKMPAKLVIQECMKQVRSYTMESLFLQNGHLLGLHINQSQFSRKEKKQKKINFQKHGSLLLEELIASSGGKYNPIRTFSSRQILQATDNFNMSNAICVV